MFEDETIDIECPKCRHKNSILVRDFEQSAESHFVCEGCKSRIKVESTAFHDRLAELKKEVDDLEREAAQDVNKSRRPRKDDFQI
jgi:transposase-like protein